MGNNDSKRQPDPNQENLEKLFVSISKKKKFINRNELQDAWASDIDPDLYSTFETYLFKHDSELNRVTFCNLFTDILAADMDHKVEGLKELITSKENAITHECLLKFITSVINSVLIIEEHKHSKNFSSWHVDNSKDKENSSLNRLGTYFLNQISDKTGEKDYTERDLQQLLTQFDIFLNIVLSHLYKIEDDRYSAHLFPKWMNNKLTAGKKLKQFSILDTVQLIFLNLELPVDYQNEWRLLFSTEIDGESFSRLSGQITNQGPTIIIIKDKQGFIFGGFAPSSWTLGPTFSGDSNSFLFTLYPEMKIFPSSNFNTNYQYMNIGQQTMPNGLGMGGRLEYFGLWLSAEFGIGSCSESCTTFRNYAMMSATKDFQIAHIEVWGVGDPPPTPAELGERSVLDSNLEAKAILEMAGRKAYSEGLREEPED